MAETWTVRRLRLWVKDYLASRCVESPMVCADLLIGHVLKCDRVRLYMDVERVALTSELEQLRALVQRAGRHEPVQYLVGTWSFFGCELEVAPSTLIPRPATEALVSEAIDRLRAVAASSAASSAASKEAETPLRIADLCTGTGCIAIAIGRALLASRAGRRQLAWQGVAPADPVEPVDEPAHRQVEIFATECVSAAAELAKRNVAAHSLGAIIHVEEGDLDAPFSGRSFENSFDLVCANPPYISDAEWADLAKNVRDYEPASALRGGCDGLDFVRRIIAGASGWLKPGGSLLVEISASQGEPALALACEARLVDVKILLDLEGHPRVLAARARAV
ncbi:MAG: peptide chain release factor N(5)-glutamine methyltransferase [Phycisphaerales bacterium]|nr:peptide chain release factor N(5)-glutamine methyltransferase [Phycisphaerales bacterium]